MPTRSPDDMARIAAGTFRMGSDVHYPEERPAHSVTVDAFWIDRHAVTNADFATFMTATGCVTFTERPLDPTLYPGAPPGLLTPGNAVFRVPGRAVRPRDLRDWWEYIPEADWRHPEGPGSTIAGREFEPVMRVVYEDAAAYAAWAGEDLPTEAEWEFVARGGLDDAAYCCGDEFTPDGRWMGNTRHGEFPWQNQALDGFPGRAPVSSFPANDYGPFDMAGNVYSRGVSETLSYDPAQPGPRVPRKVTRGGS